MSRNWKKQAETAKQMQAAEPGPQKSNYFADVPGLGNLALTRHALAKIAEDKISDEQLWDVVQTGKDTPDGMGVIFREKDGIRLVINTNPTPFKGAKVVVTAFRVQAQRKSRP